MIDVKVPSSPEAEVVVVTVPGEQKATPGEEVRLLTDAGVAHRYRAVDMWRGDVHAVPAAMLEHHADRLCRTFTGLCVYLQAYCGGAKTVERGAKLTVLVLQKLRGDEIKVVGAGALPGPLGARRP